MHFRSLTSVRGIAALLVVFHHLGYSIGGRSYLAVDLFFVLSGFVIAANYGAAFAAGVSADRYAAFMGARIARIYPMHLAVLTALVAEEAVRAVLVQRLGIEVERAPFTGPRDLAALGRHVALVHAWVPWFEQVWNGPAWSISVEFAAYLAFPFLASSVTRRPLAAAAALMAALVAGFAVVGEGPWPMLFYVYRGVIEFLLGVAAFRLYEQGRGRWLGHGAVIAALAPVGVVAIGVEAAPEWVVAPIFAALVLGLAYGGDRSFMAGAALFWLGEVSYSLYLLHVPVMVELHRAARTLDGLPFALATLAIVLPLAAVTYRWVERPARRVLRQRLAHGVAQ